VETSPDGESEDQLASTPDAVSDDVPPVKLVPLPDRRKATERRNTRYGGRREADVKRPTTDPRKWCGEPEKKSGKG
jgi:hypothetical protein